jgi:hypothetical protein
MVHVFAVILAVSSTFQLKILDCVDEQSLRSAIDSQSIERDTKVLVACSGEDTNIAVSRPRYRSSTRTVRAASATDVATEVALLSNTLVFDIPPDEPRAAPTPTAWNTHGALTLGKRHHGFRIAISGGFDTLLSSVIGNDFRYSYRLSNNLELSAGLRSFFLLPEIIFDFTPLPTTPVILGFHPRLGFVRDLRDRLAFFVQADVMPTLDLSTVRATQVPVFAANVSIGMLEGFVNATNQKPHDDAAR